MATFAFQPKWKEELICTGPGGSTFVLDFTMGMPVVFLPTDTAWAGKSPWWAKHLWPVLHDELEAWCRTNHVRLVVDAGAAVY